MLVFHEKFCNLYVVTEIFFFWTEVVTGYCSNERPNSQKLLQGNPSIHVNGSCVPSANSCNASAIIQWLTFHIFLPQRIWNEYKLNLQ